MYEHSTDHCDMSFEKWVHNKNVTRRKAARDGYLKMVAESKAAAAEEDEFDEKRKESRVACYFDQKRREARLHEEKKEQSQMDIYQDHTRVPNYQMSIVREYMSSMHITNG